MKLEQAIQQEKFQSEFQKAHLNILYTSAIISYETTQLVKPFGLTWQQFNILRILKGQHPEPATVKVLGNRMIDKTSNASRLVDKLLTKKYVKRSSNEADRRRVDIVLTDKGLEVLAEASKKVDDYANNNNGKISLEDIQKLNEILEAIRGL